MRNLTLSSLLVLALCLSACSGGNSDAPSDREAHPSGWIAMHAGEALDNPGYTDCVGCHGADLQGSGTAISCYSCHPYKQNPPFSVHPSTWSDTYSDHRVFAATNGFASCAGCHGQNLRGDETAPSCYLADVDGAACHSEVSREVPHSLAGDYRDGSKHGPEAKADLTACQSCHGEIGGPGSNPRFNIGFGDNGCEDCHGTNYAHPQGWAGPNNTFHYTSANIPKACVLCHGEVLDGGIGVSCIGCHDSVVDFTLNCSFCHDYPPTGLADVATDTGVDHSHVPIQTHLECNLCHGMSESGTGGSFEPLSNYLLFDRTTNTNGDHWDGNIQMGSDFGYNELNYGCDAATCHGASPNTPPYQLSDSGLPVILKLLINTD